QEFTAEKIVSDDESGEHTTTEDYTQYLDPKYAEQLMSESLVTANEPETAPRKGPGSETAEAEVVSTANEH
ncbi:MAG: hypothetical protein JO182_21650, partial [Acidobacteriaceae bacterium]|nr:hypothetical protein [Acidobacteriaceae bacterium]